MHKDGEWDFQLLTINLAIDELEFSPEEGKQQQFSLGTNKAAMSMLWNSEPEFPLFRSQSSGRMLQQRPSHRERQVTEAHDATALLRVPHFLIGQTLSTKLVSQKLLTHMALPRSKPLVLAFTGPSGHGKTELAKCLGELLNLEIERIDCTEMCYETDLFGPKKPYIGHELGSPLNSFLAMWVLILNRNCPYR